MLNDAPLIGFIPTRDGDAARRFYGDTLGLGFVSDDHFALVFRTGSGTMVRVIRVGDFTPATFTILGWEVKDINQHARQLAAAGVTPLRYPFLDQDALGIWTAPSRDKVLWFHDPDGNTLSLSEHVRL